MLLGIKQAQVSRSTGSKQLKESIKVMVQGTTGAVSNSDVTSIRPYAFYQNTGVTSVDFPNATYVGQNAFYNCTNLHTVNLPNATSVGATAFYSCSNLHTVNLPKVSSVTSGSTFSTCVSLATVSMPSLTLTNNNTYVFNGCTNLESLEINTIISAIGNYTFNNCNKLQTVTLNSPANVSTIGGYAFCQCKQLKNINFLNTSNTYTVNNYAFYGCESLESINFPTLSTYYTYSFYGCTKLRSVTIGYLTTNSFHSVGDHLTPQSSNGFSNIKTTFTVLYSSLSNVLDYAQNASMPISTLFCCNEDVSTGAKYVAWNSIKNRWCAWIDASTPVESGGDDFTLLPYGYVGYTTDSFDSGTGMVCGYMADQFNSDGTVSVMAN